MWKIKERRHDIAGDSPSTKSFDVDGSLSTGEVLSNLWDNYEWYGGVTPQILFNESKFFRLTGVTVSFGCLWYVDIIGKLEAE